MSRTSLVAWGVPRLSQLLPLDEDSLTQIIDYSASLSKEASAEHLKNLLGDSPGAFEFIASFNSRREAGSLSSRQLGTTAAAAAGAAVSENNSRSVAAKRGGKKGQGKASLHTAGAPRRPENYGNMSGGYKKEHKDEDYMAASRRSVPSHFAESPASLDPSPHESAISSRNVSPGPRQKTPPSASGPVISELLPNVKSKSAKASSSRQGGAGSASPSKKSLTTNDISDLTAAIAALEVSTNPTLSKEQRKCTCYASIHPLFAPAPNCLSCGKIICSLEGLQPCSFCGAPLLSNDEVQSMIRELREERGQEKMRVHNEGVQREGGPGPAPAPAPGSSSQLDAAKAHRDRLLNYQAQNARRTRVVDEAADFETPNLTSTLWMSPAQRALALKKQQRALREMEEKTRPEWEKKKTIMSLDLKGGRVTRVYQPAPIESGPSAEEEEEEEEEKAAEDLTREGGQQRSGGEAFSHNPLLATGGLLRPVWKGSAADKPTTDGQKGRKQQTWRRVQDDNDDNEQWILDGGLHGYNT